MITTRRLVSCMLAACLGVFVSGRVAAADPPGPILDTDQLAQASGQQIFEHVCQACHMPDARGAAGAGQFPALAQNPRLASADYLVSVVLMGRRNMPSFRSRPTIWGWDDVALNDAEIARVVNYVRSHFGNHYRDTVTAAEVSALHPVLDSKGAGGS